MAITATASSLSSRAPAKAAARSVPLLAGTPSLGSLSAPVKAAERLAFTAQLSLMMEVGTAMPPALEALARQAENPRFRAVILDMLQDVREGRQLSDAMRRHPRVFDAVYVSMIRAGETGGYLKDALDRLAEMQERRRELVTQLRAALTYPAVLCVLCSVVVVFVLIGVLPRFTAFFAGKEHILPWTTRVLMALSASMRGYWWAYLLGAVGLTVLLRMFRNSPLGRLTADRFLVGAPVVSRLANRIYTGQLLRTLGHLLESSVPLLDALDVTRGMMRNRFFQAFVDSIAAHVREGGKLSAAFASYPYIMESVRQMVATGEETGNLYHVMLRLAEFYDKEVHQDLKTFAAVLEPLALIVLGSVVGLIVASVVLPMFKLAQLVG